MAQRARRSTALGVMLVVLMSAACGGSRGASDAASSLDRSPLPSSIAVRSPAFAEGQPVPLRFTCRGEDVSPPLAWSNLPDGAAELGLVVDDPDAPSGTYVHWVVTGLAPGAAAVAEGQPPAGAVQAVNSAGHDRYDGPCPPAGPAHHYRFTVYALSHPVPLRQGGSSATALAAIRDAAVARGRLTATFAR